ncbi:uncharacterized protein LOC109429103 [Aedes albopictus]|uniref:H15 domain-containing protein n=1 Tax=Aedes albopictus TaxID=7160 RepID=A0ABM1Y9J7_AEDAL|nr:uncharacterized protein LOC109429103 [Aedes albopictus]
MPAVSSQANTSKGSPRSGPTYLQMIVFSMIEAQKELLPRKGISLRALKTKIAEKHTVQESSLNRSLHRALDEKVLVSTKGVGLAGSVRFHPDFAMKLKKLGDEPTKKAILDTLTKYLRTSHVQSSSDDSDDEKASDSKKKQKPTKKESVKPKSKKGDVKSADSKAKAKKAAGEPALVTGKASKKRAAEKSADEPKTKKSK